MKETVNSKQIADIKVSDILSSQIKQLAYTLEELYKTFGMNDLIKHICGNIIKIMNHFNLERYNYLPNRILPNDFKNMEKDTRNNNDNSEQQRIIEQQQHDDVVSQVIASKIQFTYQDLEQEIDLSAMSTDDLQQSYSHHTRITDLYRGELERRGIEIDLERKAVNAMEELDKIEKQRFKKAEIALPLATPEELTADELYAKHFEDLKKVIKSLQKAFELVYDWFIVRYPPLTVEDVKKLTNAFAAFLEMYRPYFDDKYRLDHYKALMLSFEKVEFTSQKASKSSRVPCARVKDKDGNPIWRGVTKEQIDALYEWEINFWRHYINMKEWFMKHTYEVNAKHGERCKADRAEQLHLTLSHHA